MSRLGVIAILAILAPCFVTPRVHAQTEQARRFVSGEVLVGYGSPEERDAAAKEMTEPKVQVRGAPVPGVVVQPLGSTISLVRVQFPERLKRGIGRDPSAELSLLLEFARNLKESDSRVKYAVPNYVDDVPLPPQDLEPHGSGRIQPQSFTSAPEPQQSQNPPNDPAFISGLLWHYQPAPVGMNAISAWKATTGAVSPGEKEVVVAVLDTGIRYDHEDIARAGNVLPGYSFVTTNRSGKTAAERGWEPDATDPGSGRTEEEARECGPGAQPTRSNWHGTHIAGTIGAVGSNNALGVTGVAWKVKVLPVRVCGKCGCALDAQLLGLLWAIGYENVGSLVGAPGTPKNPHPADVINMSMGGRKSCTEDAQIRALREDVFGKVRKAGAVIVVSAGNDGKDIKEYDPAGCPGVISVAAANRLGHLTKYSNHGGVTIMAPGGDISEFFDDDRRSVANPLQYCKHAKNPDGKRCHQLGGILSALKDEPSPLAFTYYRGGYGFLQGTSMAAPHVSGAVALALAAHPEWRRRPSTHDLIEKLLRESAAPRPDGACPPEKPCGAGLLDAAKLAGYDREQPKQVSSEKAFDVQIQLSKTTFKPGESFTFAVQANRDCNLLVYTVDANDKVELHDPAVSGAFMGDPRLAAGERRVLPVAGRARITDIRGVYQIGAVCGRDELTKLGITDVTLKKAAAQGNRSFTFVMEQIAKRIDREQLARATATYTVD